MIKPLSSQLQSKETLLRLNCISQAFGHSNQTIPSKSTLQIYVVENSYFVHTKSQGKVGTSEALSGRESQGYGQVNQNFHMGTCI